MTIEQAKQDARPWNETVLSECGYTLLTRPGNVNMGDVYAIDFELFELFGEAADGRPLYRSGEAVVENVLGADRYAYGDLRWDGCMNLAFDDQDAMLHFCGPWGLDSLNEALQAVYEKGLELMPGTADWGAHEQG